MINLNNDSWTVFTVLGNQNVPDMSICIYKPRIQHKDLVYLFHRKCTKAHIFTTSAKRIVTSANRAIHLGLAITDTYFIGVL